MREPLARSRGCGCGRDGVSGRVPQEVDFEAEVSMQGEGETGALGMTPCRDEGSRSGPKGKARLERSRSKALG